jgi:formylglycine-generating enzyme required for sulfatase activity
MYTRCIASVLMLAVVALTAGCGKATSTATTTATPVPSTATVVPPTQPPEPSATETAAAASLARPAATGEVAPAGPAPGDTWVRPTDGAVMVYVPAGAFQMGSSEVEIDDLLARCDRPGLFCDRKLYEPETPPHSVTLDGFWIDRTEVTNAQFVAYLNEFGNRREGGGSAVRFGQGYIRIQEEDGAYRVSEGAAGHPVVMVSWYGAQAYCEWVGARLPTEAEWEYAARGPAGHTYPWGDDPPTLELTRFSSGSTVAVGGYPDGASWCGAQDMAGNVWEWTADWFGPYPAGPQENPRGPASGTMRVLRGGGWHAAWQQVRSTFRLHDTAPSSVNGCIGFRCAATRQD